jgi:hypothetical protein
LKKKTIADNIYTQSNHDLMYITAIQ